MITLTLRDVQRFCSKVDSSSDGCWPWLGGHDHYGYAKFRVDGKVSVRAARVAFQVSRGPIPTGMHVLHTCDNRQCVNPSHLFLGTNRDNVRDRVAKRRDGDHKGIKNGRAKLTPDQVSAIREEYQPRASYAKFARRFGVSASTIRNIVKGRNWVNTASSGDSSRAASSPK
jgi:DNA-binding transcriptional regulator YiaG